MRPSVIPACFAGLTLACAQRFPLGQSEARGSPALHLTFPASSDSSQRSALEYDSLWIRDGSRMTRSLETVARLSFAEIGDTNIRAMVIEGVNNSGYREKPMQLRAS